MMRHICKLLSYLNLSLFSFIVCKLVSTGVIQKRDEEIADLKSKMSEVMALMPNGSMDGMSRSKSESSSPSPLFSTAQSNDPTMIVKSNLNPHASDYTPKQM